MREKSSDSVLDRVHVFFERRKALQNSLPPNTVALFFSAPPAIFSRDVQFPYRQDSDFYYLSGFREENSILVLTNEESILYLQDRDPEKETWNGLRLGVQRARDFLRMDRTADSSAFQSELKDLLRNREHLMYAFGKMDNRDRNILSAVDSLILRGRSGEFGPTRILHPAPFLHEMRMFKSDYEVELIRKAAEITCRAHRRAMEELRPGLFEYELEAIYLMEFRKHNAREAYPSIVASGANACILHYTENDARIQENQLVLVDAGCEKDLLASDVTRTFPAGKVFSPVARELYSIVLDAQKKAIDACRPGSTLDAIHDTALRILIRGLLDTGLLQGNEEEILEKETYRRFYMHRTGHWMGTDVHDAGNYFLEGKPRPLQPGMVFTVEPGLYIPDDSDIPEEMRGIGIRIEDDILILQEGCENLTQDAPKEIAEIEEIRRKSGIQ